MRPGRTLYAMRRGLTLTEVLVASLLASMVIIGSWRFFGSASTSMQVFNGLAIVDERLAFAADLLATDARRAGMYGTPHSANDPMVCPKPAEPLRAVIVEDDTSLSTWSWGPNALIEPDVCRFQSPVTSTLFHPLSISGSVITLDGAELSVGTEDAFDTLFGNRTLRITDPGGFHQFVTVADTNFGAAQLTVSPAPTQIDATGVCGVADVGGPTHEIAVLTEVRYQIIADPNDDERTLLVREELTPLGATMPGTRLIVAENVVDLQCWGDEDAGAAGNPAFAPDTHVGDDIGTATASPTSDRTERMRTFQFQISARTDREFGPYALDPRDPAEGGRFDLLTTYDVDTTLEGAALVLSVSQQVELSNLVVRSLP